MRSFEEFLAVEEANASWRNFVASCQRAQKQYDRKLRRKKLIAMNIAIVAIPITITACFWPAQTEPVEPSQIIEEIIIEEPTLPEIIIEVPAQPEVIVEEITPIIPAEPEPVSLGEFKITHYCACSKCCGEWADGITATGTRATEGRTIAVDPKVIPYGSQVLIRYADGTEHVYIAEDCGGAIKNNRIDVYMASHEAALTEGVKMAEVFIVEE